MRRKAARAASGRDLLLREQNFARLWSGRAVSVIGDGIFLVALPIETLNVSHSATTLAVVLTSRTVPCLIVLLPAGAIADRLERQSMMVIADVMRALAVMTMAGLAFAGATAIWHLIVLSIVFGLADGLFQPAAGALIPDLVSDDALVSANALMSATQTLAGMVIGPVFGGLVTGTLGSSWAFTLDSVSFVVSAVYISRITATRRSTKRASAALRSSMREGWRYCTARAWLWQALALTGLLNLVCFSPLIVLEPILVRQILGGSSLQLGLVIAAGGAGASMSSLWLVRWQPRRRSITAMWLAWALSGLSVGLASRAGDTTLVGIFAFLAWSAAMYGNILWLSVMQRSVSDEFIGRVSSIERLLSFAATPISYVAAGALAASIGVRTTLGVGGLIAVASGAAALFPSMRELDRAARDFSDAATAIE